MSIGNHGLTLGSPLLSLVFFVLTLVLTYVLPSGWKQRLIYTRWKNLLPGSRAFGELVDKDERISREQLVFEQGNNLLELQEEQHGLWY